MKMVLSLAIFSLFLMPVYAIDNIFVDFSAMDRVDHWGDKPADTDVVEDTDTTSWGFHHKVETWNPSYITISVGRTGNRGDALEGLADQRNKRYLEGTYTRRVQVRQDWEATKNAMQAIATSLNGEYARLAQLDLDVDAKLGEISTYLSTPGNDKEHPRLMDELVSIQKERKTTEINIVDATDALMNTEQSGAPGWNVTVSYYN